MQQKSSIEKKSEHYFRKASLHFTNKKYGKALKNFDKASELNPTNSNAPLQKGIVYITLGNNGSALKAFSRSKHLNEQNINTGLRAGNIHFSNGNYEAAKKWYCRNLRISPRHEISLNNLGAAQICLGETEEALVNFKKSTEYDDKYIWGNINQARALYVLGNTKESEKMFIKSMTTQFDNDFCWFSFSLLQFQIASKIEALTSLSRSYSINKKMFKNYQILSSYWSKYKLSDIEQSDKFLKSIIKDLMIDTLNRFTFVQIKKSFIHQKLEFLTIVRESLEWQKTNQSDQTQSQKKKWKRKREKGIEKNEIQEKTGVKRNNDEDKRLLKNHEGEIKEKMKKEKKVQILSDGLQQLSLTKNEQEKDKEEETQKDNNTKKEKNKKNGIEGEEFESSLVEIEKTLDDPNTFTLPPGSPRQLWIRLGNFWQWIVQYDKARECYYKALQIKETATVWEFLALCDLMQNNLLSDKILKKLKKYSNYGQMIYVYWILLEYYINNGDKKSVKKISGIIKKCQDVKSPKQFLFKCQEMTDMIVRDIKKQCKILNITFKI
ncbi:cellulose synthase operon protein c [Anaeramoeba flamelloides]|uniref:Cellulose synthase operon protein c n=1 Tax=Anaeramoeba flamelloides TaxID=1746091 RepID=A0AAV7YXG2_9EUKA|nr:cellulose synthase operon protein c [Anaeramoeba flamelloides]